MAHISIVCGNFSAGDSAGEQRIGGFARTSDMDPSAGNISWEADVQMTALAATINESIKDAAIAAAQDAGHTIGTLDKKTIYGGGVGL